MRMSDWSSDVCSSDLLIPGSARGFLFCDCALSDSLPMRLGRAPRIGSKLEGVPACGRSSGSSGSSTASTNGWGVASLGLPRSEEHTSELQSLMRISYAVFCLKKNKIKKNHDN